MRRRRRQRTRSASWRTTSESALCGFSRARLDKRDRESLRHSEKAAGGSALSGRCGRRNKLLTKFLLLPPPSNTTSPQVQLLLRGPDHQQAVEPGAARRAVRTKERRCVAPPFSVSERCCSGCSRWLFFSARPLAPLPRVPSTPSPCRTTNNPNTSTRNNQHNNKTTTKQPARLCLTRRSALAARRPLAREAARSAAAPRRSLAGRPTRPPKSAP